MCLAPKEPTTGSLDPETLNCKPSTLDRALPRSKVDRCVPRIQRVLGMIRHPDWGRDKLSVHGLEYRVPGAEGADSRLGRGRRGNCGARSRRGRGRLRPLLTFVPACSVILSAKSYRSYRHKSVEVIGREGDNSRYFSAPSRCNNPSCMRDNFTS